MTTLQEASVLYEYETSLAGSGIALVQLHAQRADRVWFFQIGEVQKENQPNHNNRSPQSGAILNRSSSRPYEYAGVFQIPDPYMDLRLIGIYAWPDKVPMTHEDVRVRIFENEESGIRHLVKSTMVGKDWTLEHADH